MFFPKIALVNRFFLGDSVIIEPLARYLSGSIQTAVISRYPEIFENHPVVEGLDISKEVSANVRTLDLADAIKNVDSNGKFRDDKLKQIWNKFNLNIPEKPYCTPMLFLSEQEKEAAEAIKRHYNGIRIGIVLHSKHPQKNWDNVEYVIKKLQSSGCLLFFISDGLTDEEKYLQHVSGIFLLNKPIREIMTYLSTMNVVIGPDTGPMHVAGALQVPLVVIGYSLFENLYKVYENAVYNPVQANNELAWAAISPRKVIRQIHRMLQIPQSEARGIYKKHKTAFLLLEGIGGTVTLSDHVKKWKNETGEKPSIIIRSYQELFYDNPNIDDIECVGTEDVNDCINRVKHAYNKLVAIKTGLPRIYIDGFPDEKQEFTLWEEIYESHPRGVNQLERYGLNCTQLVDKILGLPYDRVESEVFSYGKPDFYVPEEYVVVANGVDTWHKGLVQTKCWPQDHWEELVSMLDIHVLQVGTDYDQYIEGAIDLRGWTNIPQILTILRDARAIICTEGGIMHLSYAVRNFNTFVLRGPTKGNFYGYKELYNIDSFICQKPCHWLTKDWYRECPRGYGDSCMATITPRRVILEMRSAGNSNELFFQEIYRT